MSETQTVQAIDLVQRRTPPYLILDGVDVLRITRCEYSAQFGRVFFWCDTGEEFNVSPAAHFGFVAQE